MSEKIEMRVALFAAFFLMFVFLGCQKSTKVIPLPSPVASPATGADDGIEIILPGVASPKPGEQKKPGKIKTENFTEDEKTEISRDGYLAYFYRRKFDDEEKKLVWQAVNKLCPGYSEEDKLHAVRSTLAYHWVVYRTTLTHNMAANLRVTRKYHDMIKRFSKLHQVPEEMVEAVITWENSGGITKKSWAECVGVGQLSTGAVNTAHHFYVPYVRRSGELSSIYKKMGDAFDFPMFNLAFRHHHRNSITFNIAEKHRKLRIAAGVDDERLIPECNIEDAVIYLKLLYNNYGHRMDLAISAYHNGGLNNNDIIRNYLKRNHQIHLDEETEHKEILKAINEKNVQFIDLWKDRISRDMLNGLRTVYGHITDDSNRRLALVDESDIYLWKVIAAYAALQADSETLNRLMKKYRGEWDVAECRGLKVYNSIEAVRNGIRSGYLVKLPPVYTDKGISKIEGENPDYYKNRAQYNYYVTPETAGFLIKLAQVYRNRTGNPDVKIPLRGALESRILETVDKDRIPEKRITHLQGVALDIDINNAPYQNQFHRIIMEGYLHDRIFLVRKGGESRVCVNPRYGKHYYEIYRQYKATGKI